MTKTLLVENDRSRAGASVLARLRSLPAGPGGLDALCRRVTLAALDSVESAPDRVIAVGGDGTVNATIGWLARKGFDCPVGIVPAGTGNNLARGLGLPLAPAEAFEIALRGDRVRPLDVFRYVTAEGHPARHIVQTSAMGYPAAMAARYDALRRFRILRVLFRPLGTSVYRIIGLLGLAGQKLRELRRRGLLDVRLELPDETVRETVFAVFLGNERSLGGNFVPCPEALVDDGVADICLVRAGTGASYLDLFRRISRGTHLSCEDSIVYRRSPGPIHLSLSEPSPLLVDGDIRECAREYRVEVLPRRFRILRG